MFIEILFKMLLFKGGVLIYAEHCIYIYIYIYIYVYIYTYMYVYIHTHTHTHTHLSTTPISCLEYYGVCVWTVCNLCLSVLGSAGED